MKNKYSTLSLLIGIVDILALVYINSLIAERYVHADGKTRAFFSLIEMGFYYKFYLLIPIVLGLVLARVAYRRKENKIMTIIGILSNLLAVVIMFTSIWKFMI